MAKLLHLSALIFCSFLGNTSFANAATRYPYVESFAGSVEIIGIDGNRNKLQKTTQLLERAQIFTAAKSTAEVVLDADRKIVILPESELLMPSIGWDSQQVPLLVLKKGRVRWVTSGSEEFKYPIALSSDLYQFIVPRGEFEFSLYPNKAQAFVKVFEGELNFSALNAEESVNLTRGQMVSFQGVLDDGKIAYDVLLKGIKIPKGKLGVVTKVDNSELKAQELEKQKLKRMAEFKRKQAQEQAQRILADGFICQKPYGKLNQCAWVCQGMKSKSQKCQLEKETVWCERVRCNANGEWSDSYRLNKQEALQKCLSAKPLVDACDY
ncbi:MAG: hypothetical protein ACLGGX_07090 [Bdellovibrionia bacterium]